jgi:RsiW-degrading membrane proteinase PrsW (M82 family)
MSALLFVLVYVPVLAILWYVYHKDKLEPEPKRYVLFTFLYGSIVSIGIAIFFESIAYVVVPQTALTISIVSAIIEEPSKALAVRFAYDSKQMDGVMDGVVYGVSAGLGFSATENILYGLGFGIEVTLIRAFLTPIGHSAWATITGVGYGLKSGGKAKTILPFLSIAILFHFTWNYLVFLSKDPIYIGFIALLFLLNVLVIRHFVYLGEREDRAKYLGM